MSLPPPVMHHVIIDGQQRGPFSMGQLQSMWRSGAVNRETPHFMDGYDEWLPLSVIEEDLEPRQQLAAAATYPPAGYHPHALTPPKSRGIYIILGLLGGGLGLHNFYVGRYGAGVAQLLIVVAVGWLIVPLFAVGIWVIIELCAVDRDGKGRKLD